MTKCACCGNMVAVTNKLNGSDKDYLVCIGCTDKIERIFAKELYIEDVKSLDTDPMLIQDIELMRKGKLSLIKPNKAMGINRETIIWAVVVFLSLSV